MKNILAIACDHGGYELKLDIMAHLEKRGVEFACKKSVAGRAGPTKATSDVVPLLACPLGRSTTPWDVLTNACHSVGCTFDVYPRRVVIK